MYSIASWVPPSTKTACSDSQNRSTEMKNHLKTPKWEKTERSRQKEGKCLASSQRNSYPTLWEEESDPSSLDTAHLLMSYPYRRTRNWPKTKPENHRENNNRRMKNHAYNLQLESNQSVYSPPRYDIRCRRHPPKTLEGVSALSRLTLSYPIKPSIDKNKSEATIPNR